MKKSMILDHPALERILAKTDYENIIVGTGALAKDIRRKLSLLGLKATFLAGMNEDLENDIICYKNIPLLGNPEKYRFIMCCDEDEWELYYLASSIIYRFLKLLMWYHPQVIKLTDDFVKHPASMPSVTDAVNGNTLLKNGYPYTVSGTDKDDALRIHLLGSSYASSLWKYSTLSLGDALYNKLSVKGFSVKVYSWGQALSTVSDNIIHLLRDICIKNCDAVIFYTGLSNVNPLLAADKNLLHNRVGVLSAEQPFYPLFKWTYEGNASNGVNHNTDMFLIRKYQQRSLIALSKLHGFRFLDIIAPHLDTLPDSQAEKLGIYNQRAMLRQRKKRDKLTDMLDKRYTKDYSRVLDGIEDIYSMFSDGLHLSAEGNNIIAEKLAEDILNELKNN